MNMSNKRWIGVALAFLFLTASLCCSNSPETETFTYALESDGRVFGYQEVEISRIEEDGRPLILIRESGRTAGSALGAEIDSQVRTEHRLDPDTWRLVSSESLIDQESLKLRVAATAAGDSVRITIEPGGAEKTVLLEPDVVFENPVLFPHLKRDFEEAGTTAKTYRILDLIDRKVHRATYTLRGMEPAGFAGEGTEAIVLDCLNLDIGLKLRLWIDRETGRLLKLMTPRSTITLAAKPVEHRLQRKNLDNEIYSPAGVRIADIAAISRLKAEAVLEPVGNWITVESLNVPGQVFEGTVVDNRIEGVFEIAHGRYDGRNSPPYPPDYGDRPELKSFVSPEDFIESDDPVLVEKARELAAGSADSWEAAKRLSRWVADNIGYDIPGGATARKTYDLREGECGAHSRLFAAFCRAVGIPARVVWGCMYVPDRGGSFGQHGWNEVFMGEAGWVPIDTTARQIDFVDSGHIRLGILSSAHVAWNPERMDVLDFEAGSQSFGESRVVEDADRYRPYLGKYRGPKGGTFTALLQGGGLAIDIPGRGIFELRDPGDGGTWYLKLSGDVAVSFREDGGGRATELVLTNKIRIPRMGDLQSVPDDVPGELRAYLGRYPIPMDKREILVLFRRGGLAVDLPGTGIRTLEGPDGEGVWTAGPGGERFSFVKDDSQKVKSMVLVEVFRCPRID